MVTTKKAATRKKDQERDLAFMSGRRAALRSLLYLIAGELTGRRVTSRDLEAELAGLLAERLDVLTKLRMLCHRLGLPNAWTDRDQLGEVLGEMLARLGERDPPRAPGKSTLRERLARLGQLEGYPGAVWLADVMDEVDHEPDQA